MTAVAETTDRVAILNGNSLVFPCASCGAELTIKFGKDGQRPTPPARITGHCPCNHETAYVFTIDGDYEPAKTRPLGEVDVRDAEHAHGCTWREFMEAQANDEPMEVRRALQDRMGNSYVVFHETLRQALADAERIGYTHGFEDGKKARTT